MKLLYQHKRTGELLTQKEMLKVWQDEYDGGDPTNTADITEAFDIVIHLKGQDCYILLDDEMKNTVKYLNKYII